MFRYICIILRELKSCTSLKLRSVYTIKMLLKIIKLIFMWLLLIKCSLYDFLQYNLYQYIYIYIHIRTHTHHPCTHTISTQNSPDVYRAL